MLKAVDIYVLLGLLAIPRDDAWTQARFAADLHLPQAAMTRSLQRLEEAGLWDRAGRAVDRPGAEGLLVHAVRFLLPAHLGPPTRGLPTAHAAPPLRDLIASDQPYVWPMENGGATGISLEPLHAAAPVAAREQPRLYELLALVDALRAGRARERVLAARELHARIIP